MQDYSSIGLNNLGFPTNAPISQQDGDVSAYDFDSKYTPPTGGFNYTHLSPDSRAYTAVVSLSGEGGTFVDLQAAFDYVRRLGGGRILVLPGTYTISKELTVYSDTIVEGLSAADCIIDFNNTANNISVFLNGQNVEFRYLSFINCTDANGAINTNSAQRISVKSCLFDTNTLDVYNNDSGHVEVQRCVSTGSGTFYKALTPNSLSWVVENEVYNTTSYTFQNAKQTNFINNYIQYPGTHIFEGDCSFSVISNSLVIGGPVAALDLQNAADVTVSNNYFGNYVIMGTTHNCRITNNYFGSSKGSVNVVDMDGCNDNIFMGNTLKSGTHNGIDGFNLNNDCNDNSINSSVILLSSGLTSYAVNIVDIASANNIIVGNYLQANTADINDGGTSTVAGNNS